MQNVLDGLVAAVILASRENVMNVKKRSSLQSDVDKSRLHAGQHPHDFAFVDVADESPLGTSFDMEVLKDTVDHHGHSGFLRGAVN